MIAEQQKSETQSIEKLLRNYTDFKMAVQNLKRSVDLDITIKTTRYDHDKRGDTSVTYSPVEKAILGRSETDEQIKKYQLLIDSIDKALSLLTSDQRQFVEMRYFQDFSITRISTELMFSVRQIYRLRKKALNRLAIALSPFLFD